MPSLVGAAPGAALRAGIDDRGNFDGKRERFQTDTIATWPAT